MLHAPHGSAFFVYSTLFFYRKCSRIDIYIHVCLFVCMHSPFLIRNWYKRGRYQYLFRGMSSRLEQRHCVVWRHCRLTTAQCDSRAVRQPYSVTTVQCDSHTVWWPRSAIAAQCDGRVVWPSYSVIAARCTAAECDSCAVRRSRNMTAA